MFKPNITSLTVFVICITLRFQITHPCPSGDIFLFYANFLFCCLLPILFSSPHSAPPARIILDFSHMHHPCVNPPVPGPHIIDSGIFLPCPSLPLLLPMYPYAMPPISLQWLNPPSCISEILWVSGGHHTTRM